MLLTGSAGAMHAEQLGRLWEQETRYRGPSSTWRGCGWA